MGVESADTRSLQNDRRQAASTATNEPVNTEQQSQGHPDEGEWLEEPPRAMRAALPPVSAKTTGRPRGQWMRFAVPFMAVIGHYLVGVVTFAVMTSSSAPNVGDLSFFLAYAVERTIPFALIAALAAGCCWR